MKRVACFPLATLKGVVLYSLPVLLLGTGCERANTPTDPAIEPSLSATPNINIITLDFNTLPSAQGWTYLTSGGAETSIFSVSGGVLTQNTLAGPFTGEGYQQFDVVDPSLPFTISIRARVLAESGNFTSNSFGFCFGGLTGPESFVAGIGTGRIEDVFGNVLSTTIDNTQFHDYRLEATPGVGYEFFVDDALLATGPPRPRTPPQNILLFGDCTAGAGAHAEMTAYTFSQDVSPREDRVTICHKGITLAVAESAVSAHLRHGDTEGPCD
jgi:hypothetical protein